MNKKQLKIIIATFTILVACALIVLFQKYYSWNNPKYSVGGAFIPEFDLNSIKKIIVSDNGNKITVSNQHGSWKVRDKCDYPADFSFVRAVIQKINNLKVTHNIKVADSKLGRMSLNLPSKKHKSGTLIELFDHENRRVVAVVMGKKHFPKKQNPYLKHEADGRYMRSLMKKGYAALISKQMNEVQPIPSLWLNKEFIRPVSINIIAAYNKNKKNEWGLFRDGPFKPFKLLPSSFLQKLNNKKIATLLKKLQLLSFINVYKNNLSFIAKSDRQLKLKTTEGFFYYLYLKKSKNRFYLKISTAFKPFKRIERAGESAIEKVRLDKAHKLRIIELKKKYQKEKQYTKWVYEITYNTFKDLSLTKKELLLH